MPFDRETYYEALRFVMEVQKNQSRGNGDPYLLHLLRVSTTVLSANLSPELKPLRDRLGIAALLHDAIEDATENKLVQADVEKQIFDKFGGFITSIVKELTQDLSLPKDQRRAQMVEHCSTMSIHAQVIKLADRYDNCRDMKDMSKKFIERYLVETPEMLKRMKGACPDLELKIWGIITPMIQQQNADKATIVQKRDA